MEGSKAVKVCEVDGPVVVEAARSCSRADCGRRTLSPWRPLEAYREGWPTLKEPDQLSWTGSAAIFDVIVKQVERFDGADPIGVLWGVV